MQWFGGIDVASAKPMYLFIIIGDPSLYLIHKLPVFNKDYGISLCERLHEIIGNVGGDGIVYIENPCHATPGKKVIIALSRAVGVLEHCFKENNIETQTIEVGSMRRRFGISGKDRKAQAVRVANMLFHTTFDADDIAESALYAYMAMQDTANLGAKNVQKRA